MRIEMAMCEDFPCCGHERGDCDGSLYGSDEAIMSSPHVLCDHESGDCVVQSGYVDDGDDYCLNCGGDVGLDEVCDCTFCYGCDSDRDECVCDPGDPLCKCDGN